MEPDFQPRISAPSNILIAGASQSGKTCLVSQIVIHREQMFSKKFNRIVWCYGEFQPAYTRLEAQVPEITWVEGLPSDLYTSFSAQDINLLILDDLMDESNASVAKLFTKGSHHRNLTVIFMVQNLFFKSKESRTISLNAHYLILFKNPREQSQIVHLARQVYPGESKFLMEAYADATAQPHGYLMIDFMQETPERHRLRTGILPHDQQYVYVRK